MVYKKLIVFVFVPNGSLEAKTIAATGLKAMSEF